MRGDVIYQIFGMHDGRNKDMFFGAFRTVEEAQTAIKALELKEMNGQNWAKQYHNRGFAIREKEVDTDFEIPSQPKPRDKYFVKTKSKPNRPGTWDSTIVEVYRRNFTSGSPERVCEYERNYAMLGTFEPFRQGNREFALISRQYTQTAVLDLASGEIIAEETSNGSGFCPVGFYVPDWWDINDDSIIPGSHYWSTDEEWPTGDMGFVWGCYWGDDTFWKVQFLDLRQIQEGIISREERFGYVELATHGYKSPCFTPHLVAQTASAPPPFIEITRENGSSTIIFSVEMMFDLGSGKPFSWQRKD